MKSFCHPHKFVTYRHVERRKDFKMVNDKNQNANMMWKRSENIKKFHNDSMSKMSFWTMKIKLLCAGSSESKFYIAQCTCLQDQPSKCYYRELGMTKPSSTQQILVFSSPTSTTQAALRPQPNTEDTDSCNKWRKANHMSKHWNSLNASYKQINTTEGTPRTN